MSDLIRAIESDLFGSFEWSADLYEDLRGVSEPADKLAVLRGLFRAYNEFDGRADDAMRTADEMVAAEAALPPDVATVLAPFDAARENLLETASPAAARAFLAVFEPAWARGPHAALVPDAILAALAKSNLLASRREGEARALHRESAGIYSEVSRILHDRLETGETIWTETAASAVNRRVVALRLAGDDESARRFAEAMGAESGAWGGKPQRGSEGRAPGA